VLGPGRQRRRVLGLGVHSNRLVLPGRPRQNHAPGCTVPQPRLRRRSGSSRGAIPSPIRLGQRSAVGRGVSRTATYCRGGRPASSWSVFSAACSTLGWPAWLTWNGLATSVLKTVRYVVFSTANRCLCGCARRACEQRSRCDVTRGYSTVLAAAKRVLVCSYLAWRPWDRESPERGGLMMKSTLLMALVAGVMLCGCGAQKRLRIGACDAHRQEAALVTRYVVVYGSRAASPAITTFYACQRPAEESVRVGIDELGSVYGSDATTGSLRAAGTYVAAQSSTGEATLAVCARYSNSRRCPPAQHWLTVIDTRDRRRARIPVYASLPVPALVPFPVPSRSRRRVRWRGFRTAPLGRSSAPGCSSGQPCSPLAAARAWPRHRR